MMRGVLALLGLLLAGAAQAQTTQYGPGPCPGNASGCIVVPPGSFGNRATSLLASDELDIRAYGAVGDGNSHPLSGKFASLAAAQVYCPDAVSTSDELDWCALDQVVHIAEARAQYSGLVGSTGLLIRAPAGLYRMSETITANDVSLEIAGDGPKNTIFQWAGIDGLNFGLSDVGQGGSLTFRNLSISNSGAGGVAITASFDIAMPTLTLDHVDFPRGGSGYWTKDVVCTACSYAYLNDTHSFGLLNTSTNAFELTDNNTQVGHYGNKFLDQYIIGFQNGYQLTNASTTGMQGQYWRGNNVIQGQDFLKILNTSGTSPPQYTLIQNQWQGDGCFVDAATAVSIQDLNAVGNEILVGNGQMSSPPATGGAFCLQSDVNSIIVANQMSVTGTDTLTVSFLTTGGINGIVTDNKITNPQSPTVTANGVVLQNGSTGWIETANVYLGGLTANVTDNGTANNTSLAPKLTAPVITGGATVSGNLQASNLIKGSVATGITAAGSTQGGATALNAIYSVVPNVSAGTGVRLAAFVGTAQWVYNSSANALLVYPPTNSAINGGGANAAVSLAAGEAWWFIPQTSAIIEGTPFPIGGVFASAISGPSGTFTALRRTQGNIAYVKNNLSGCPFTLTANEVTIFDAAGLTAACTVTMPASPADGDITGFTSKFNVTALTVSANSGQSITGAPTTITSTTPVKWIWVASETTWYRSP